MLGRCHACDPERGAGETGVDVTAQAPETGTRSGCRQPDSEEPNLKMGGQCWSHGKGKSRDLNKGKEGVIWISQGIEFLAGETINV